MSERTIFLTALDKDNPHKRTAYLDEACAGDRALRQRVEALLRSHEAGGSFLEEPAVAQVAAACPAHAATEAADPSHPAVQIADPPGKTQAEPAVGDAPALAFLTPSQKPDSLGRLDHYEVLEVVGTGGMGVVLKAFDEKLHRVVAVKVLAPQLATSGTARKRFVREAQAAAAVSHDHVVAIYAVEEKASVPYLVMQFIDGISLQDRINQGGPLPLREILRIGLQAAHGLAAAHKQGLVHRDIKPANILLENGVQRVKITDFGLARAADDASLTQSGVIAGTPMYMSPEQARGEVVDHRTDLFSLGTVLYTLCTGRPPFRADNTMAVLKRVCEDTPRAIREVNAEIPDWLCAIVDRLLAKEPAQRFQSAAEVAELLSQHLAHLQQPQMTPLPPALTPVAQVPRRPRRTRAVLAAALAALLLATLGAGVAYWLLRPGPPGQMADDSIPPRPTTSPFDERRREDIPLGLLTLAGGGDPEQAPRELVAVLGDHRFILPGAGPAGQMAQSPDGKLLAVGRGGTVVLFDRDTGAVVRILTGHTGRVWTVAFSPDGRLLASACRDLTDHDVRLWDISTGQLKYTLSGHTGFVYSVVFNHDGRRLFSAGEDKGIRVWDTQTGKSEPPLEGHTAAVVKLALSPDGKHLASGGSPITWNGPGNFTGENSVKVWDAQTGQLLHSLTGHTGFNIPGLAFSPDGKWLATGAYNGWKLWDREAGYTEVFAQPQRADWLVFTPDSQTLLIGPVPGSADIDVQRGFDDGTSGPHALSLWDVPNRRPRATYTLNSRGGYPSYLLDRDGQTLFAFRCKPAEPYIRAYDLDTGKERPRQGHEGHVLGVAVSRDGKLLASGGDDRIVRVWNLAEWKKDAALPPVRTFSGHTDVVWCVAFSPDGKFLASSSRDRTITLWDLAGDRDPQILPGAADVTVRMAFSPNGRSLVAGCEDGGVRSWKLPGDEEGVLLCRHAARVRCVAFSPDGTLMASAGDDRQVWVSDVRTTRLRHPPFSLPSVVNNVEFSPDGRTLAATCDAPDSAVHLWDVADWKEARVPGHSNHVHGLAFSSAAPLMATGSHDGTLRVWDLSPSALANREAVRETPHVLTIRPGPFGNAVYHVACTPEGRYLVTANGNGTISVLKVPAPPPPYDPGPVLPLPDPAELAKRPSPADALRRADIPAELLAKAAASAGGEAPRELVAVLTHSDQKVTAVAVSPDGKFLASAGYDGTAKLWDLADGKLLHPLSGHRGSVISLAFGLKRASLPRKGGEFEPGALLLATAGEVDGTVKLWEVDTGKEIRTMTGHTTGIRHVAFSPDGRWLACGDAAGTIWLWDPATGQRLRTLPGAVTDYGLIAFSPDSRLLAAAGADGLIRLWDAASGWQVGALVGHQGLARAVAFLPDGRTLASSGQADRTVRLWDLTTLRPKQTLEGTRTYTVSLAWRADGRLLASDDAADGKVRLWDLSANPPRGWALRLFPADTQQIPGQSVHGVALTPEGRYLATANPDGTVYILRLAERGEVFQVPAARD